MNEQEHAAHMEQIKAGLEQIIQIAQAQGMNEIVQIAQSLLEQEQQEQASEGGEGEAPAGMQERVMERLKRGE